MKTLQLTGALVLLVATSPLFAAAPSGRNTEGAAPAAAPTAAVVVLPEMPLLALNLAKGTSLLVTAQARELQLIHGSAAFLAARLPIVGAIMRRAGNRFSTTDSSHPYDFAMCYRVLPRMGLQVIPGDPTPSNFKLPVSTIANNTGVTVGMTLRIGRTR